MSKGLVDFTELPPDGELWELFARDFLQEIGFFIENQPNRGADGGKDILVSEQLSGLLNKYRWKWLVSCKHFAKSNKSVSEEDEINIQERLDNFGADGFMGFYSTIPSSGLNSRLEGLKANGKIKDYRVFDSRLIENYMIRIGFSDLLLRYFPLSYKTIKPLHLIFDEYIPLQCPVCEKDILETLHEEKSKAVIASVIDLDEEGRKTVIDIYWACKGECDRKMEYFYRDSIGKSTQWQDLSDIMVPYMFLHWIIVRMNQLRGGRVFFTDEAFEKEKLFIMAMSQRVLREMTKEERDIALKNMRLFNMF